MSTSATLGTALLSAVLALALPLAERAMISHGGGAPNVGGMDLRWRDPIPPHVPELYSPAACLC